jgi:tetrahydromethanopterin S-methyltransferase subunit F
MFLNDRQHHLVCHVIASIIAGVAATVIFAGLLIVAASIFIVNWILEVFQ